MVFPNGPLCPRTVHQGDRIVVTDPCNSSLTTVTRQRKGTNDGTSVPTTVDNSTNNTTANFHDRSKHGADP